MKKQIIKIFFISCAIITSAVFCDMVFAAAPTPKYSKTEGDAKVYTYKSECDCSPTVSEYTCSKDQDQTIIFNQNTTAWDTAYIFQHGDGFRESGDFCGWKLNICENINDKAKNILFVGFKMAGSESQGKLWSGNYNAQCLHKEAKAAAENIIGVGKFPNKLILASYSQGGIAVSKMFEKNKQPSGIIYSIFLDSCFGDHCEVVANKSTSVRGIMKMYRSTIQTDSKDWEIKNAQQNEAATTFMNNNPPDSTSLSAINGKHGDVPANCSFDFLLNNNCNNKTLSGSITGTGSTPGVGVPFVNEIIQLTKPTPKITIPGLNFSDIKVVDEPGGKFLYIPFLGEYIAAIYKYGVAIASIFAVVMIINQGFGWAISGGEPEKINHAKTRIGQAIVGLFLAVGSYTLLYMINPDLVKFRSLRVQYNPQKLLTDAPFYESGESTGQIGVSASSPLTLPTGNDCGKNLPSIAKSFVDQGPICGERCDCANFVSTVLKQSGCDSNFQSNSATGLVSKLKAVGWKDTSNPQPGDMLYYYDGTKISHATVVYTTKTVIDSSVDMTACWPKDKVEQILKTCKIETPDGLIGGKEGFWEQYELSYTKQARIDYSNCVASFNVCPPLAGVQGDKCNYCNKLNKNLAGDSANGDCSSRQCIKISDINKKKKYGVLSNPYK